MMGRVKLLKCLIVASAITIAVNIVIGLWSDFPFGSINFFMAGALLGVSWSFWNLLSIRKEVDAQEEALGSAMAALDAVHKAKAEMEARMPMQLQGMVQAIMNEFVAKLKRDGYLPEEFHAEFKMEVGKPGAPSGGITRH